MNRYSKTFTHQNREAKIIALACLLFGALFYGFGNSSQIPMPIIFQLVGVALIVWSVYMATRFLLKQYAVAVVEDQAADDTAPHRFDLIVYERKGKREPKVCHISLSSITTITVISKESYKTEQKEKIDGFRYIYDTNFAWKKRIKIIADTGDYQSMIYLSYDEGLFKILSENT